MTTVLTGSGYSSVEECKTAPCLGYSLPAFTGFELEDCHGELAMVMGSRDAKETSESLDEAPEPTYPLRSPDEAPEPAH